MSRSDAHAVAAMTSANPCRQDGCAGVQPNSRRALRFEPARFVVIIATMCSPAASRASQRGMRRGGLRDDHPCERGQPFANGSWVVVDNVVKAGRAFFDSESGRRSRVVDVQERPPAIRVADQRRAAAAQEINHRAVEKSGAWSVEGAVAQHETVERRRPRDRALEMADRVQRVAEFSRRRRVQGVLLRLDRPSGPRERPAAKALRDEAARLGLPRRREQVIQALRPQAIGRGERPIEMRKVACAADCGHFVNDDLGAGVERRLAQPRRVKRDDDDGRGACARQRLGL